MMSKGDNSIPHKETRPVTEGLFNMLDSGVMWHGVNIISPSSWEPQEEGMMSTAANFSLSKKPRFVSPGKSQTSEGDAC
jgi:hypothetical protein